MSEHAVLDLTPSRDGLRPPEVKVICERLHGILTEDTDSRFASPDRSRLEMRLHTSGDGSVEQSIATKSCHGVAVENALHAGLPDSYELAESELPPLPDELPGTCGAIELRGRATRRRDWQTGLVRFADLVGDTDATVPLDGVAEAMATADFPVVFQVLLAPHPDWSGTAAARRRALEDGTDGTLQVALDALLLEPEPDRERDLPETARRRISSIDARDPRRSFVVNARALAWDAPDQQALVATLDAIGTAFGHVDDEYHHLHANRVTGDTDSIRDALRERTLHDPSYESLRNRLPWTTNRSRGIVADAGELPAFLFLDGGSLSRNARRALDVVPGERVALSRPPESTLDRYRGTGMPLGYPRTGDQEADARSLALPPSLQPLHVAWFGQTGAGKSTALTNAILDNQAATAGLDLLVDPKGDGMAEEYLRAHYARHGDLENVYYFDCSECLPALSFFDVRADLDAGVPRETAVADVADHFIEILQALMGAERFDRAVRSPDVIRYLVHAMFDPGCGNDAFGHADLLAETRRMHSREEPPAVDDPRLQRLLEGVTEDSSRTFSEVMTGVRTRLEKVSVDRRVAALFEPTGEDRPSLDLHALLDEDSVLVLDTGGLRERSQHAVTLVVLSELWRALRRRTAQHEQGEDSPLVNCYLEEAASFANADLLTDLLARSRAFDCSITLAMQFPGQLRATGNDGVYEEVLNNVGTYVVGPVPSERRLAERLATADMDAEAVGIRLRGLARGEWLVSLPAPFDVPAPRPFTVESLAPPDPAPSEFEGALETLEDRTAADAGRTLEEPAATSSQPDDTEDAPPRLDSALPYTRHMPRTVKYESDAHALRCIRCNSYYEPTGAGMKRAITCCSSLEAVDRDDVPVCEVNCKLTPEQRQHSDYTDRQLHFLQAVHNVRRGTFTDLEYDPLRDSMVLLRNYLGLTAEAVEELVEDGLLRLDTDQPHRLYSISAQGREEIGESVRHGYEYGHGAGDLNESVQHMVAVELGRRYVQCEYVDDPDSPVERVVPYYDVDEDDAGPAVAAASAMGGDAEALEEDRADFRNRRLDVAGLDTEDEVVVTAEAERINNSAYSAIPQDFDTMAACDPEDAIWIVMSHDAAHKVLSILNDPPEGPVRVEKTYSDSTLTQDLRFEEPGLTEMATFHQLHRKLVAEG